MGAAMPASRFRAAVGRRQTLQSAKARHGRHLLWLATLGTIGIIGVGIGGTRTASALMAISLPWPWHARPPQVGLLLDEQGDVQL